MTILRSTGAPELSLCRPAGDDLLGERLRIRVDVRPAPVLSTFGAELGRSFADPHLPFAEYRGFQFRFVIRIAAFSDKPVPRQLTKLSGLYRVVASCRACSLRRAQSSTSRLTSNTVPFNSSLRGNIQRPARSPRSCRCVCRRQNTSRHERPRLLHHPRQLDDVVRSTTFVRNAVSSGGLKVTLPAPLMMTSVACILLRLFFLESEIFISDIAVDRDHLGSDEVFESVPVFFA